MNDILLEVNFNKSLVLNVLNYNKKRCTLSFHVPLLSFSRLSLLPQNYMVPLELFTGRSVKKIFFVFKKFFENKKTFF